jgi:squalene synthase HpnC
VAAIYAFARAADDFADEGDRSSEERLLLLEGWRCRLRAASGDAEQAPSAHGEPAHAPEIFTALAATMREKRLDVEPFEDLLSAFAQDVTVSRYATWADLLDYCRRSASPVGRLVLRVAGYRSDRLEALSDQVCTALQLTNFWQDAKPDFERGRIYLPEEELRTHGAGEGDFAAPALTGGLHDALRAAVLRTRALFESGRPVCDEVNGRLRYELRATWLGGTRVLDRIEASAFDPIRRRPRLGPGDLPWLAWRVVRWRREPQTR